MVTANPEDVPAVELPERVVRRNRLLFISDYASFGVGMNFLAATTVLPGLVRLLGGNALVVGSLGAIQSGCWLLPQLIAGRYAVNRALVKKHAVLPAFIGRMCLVAAMPLLLFFANRAPALALGGFLVAYAGFWIGDASSAVGWFELLGKAIPLGQRGRVMGIGQTASSVAALGVGAAVTAILAWPNPFPINYVVIILLANIGFLISVGSIALIKETRGVGHTEVQIPWKEYGPRLVRILRTDPRFFRFTVVRLLAGMADMAANFYILFAADRLGISESMIGAFITAGVVGSLLSGAVLGPLGDRKGSSVIVKTIMVARCVIPLLALAAPQVLGIHGWLAPALMVIVFGAMGLTRGADFIGFMMYLLEITPAGERSLYVGLSNTLGGLAIVAPLLAGWLLEATSYEVLFLLVLGLAAVGLLVALRLPSLHAARPSEAAAP